MYRNRAEPVVPTQSTRVASAPALDPSLHHDLACLRQTMTSFGIQTRSAKVDDAWSIQKIYAPIVEHTAISFEEVPPSVDEIAARICNTLQGYPYLVAEKDGQVVGYAYAGQHRARDAYRWSVDVSAYVAEDSRSLGIGKALYGDLLAALSGRGFHSAFAGIALPNAASVAFHETMGFEPVGVYREVGFKLGRWHDLGRWQRRLHAPSEIPAFKTAAAQQAIRPRKQGNAGC